MKTTDDRLVEAASSRPHGPEFHDELVVFEDRPPGGRALPTPNTPPLLQPDQLVEKKVKAAPRRLITDKLRSYSTADRTVMPSTVYSTLSRSVSTARSLRSV